MVQKGVVKMVRSIMVRFSKQCETRDNHHDELLKTHYYKGSFSQIFAVVEKLVRDNGKYKVMHVSKEHGEISVELTDKQGLFIITIVAVKPYECAVDLHISTESFSLFGAYPFLKKELVSFYQKVNNIAQLTAIGKNI
jgi:hypothetical protein